MENLINFEKQFHDILLLIHSSFKIDSLNSIYLFTF